MPFRNRLLNTLRDEKAFGIVEALMAMTIMTLVLVALLGLLVTSVKAVYTSKLSTVATQIANESLEKVRSMGYDSIGIYGRDPMGLLYDETRTVSGVLYTTQYDMQWIDDAADGTGIADAADQPQDQTHDYKQVFVNVSWIDKDTTRTISASTFIKSKPLQTDPPTVNFIFDDDDTNTPPNQNTTPPDGSVFGTDDSPYKAWFDAGQIPLRGTGTDPDNDLVTMHFFIGPMTPNGGNYSINPAGSFTNTPALLWDPSTKDPSDTAQYLWGEGTHEVTVEVWDARGNRDAKNIHWTIDRDPPAVPSNPNAVEVDDSSINVIWQASQDGLDQVERYQIYRRGPGESLFTIVADTEFSPTSPSYNSAGLNGWSTYQYYMKAVSPGGRVSLDSSTVAATTKIGLTAPVTKHGNDRTVNLTWSENQSGINNVDKFKIYRNGAWLADVGGGSSTSGSDTTASKNTTYTYRVDACDSDDLVVKQSITISVYTD